MKQENKTRTWKINPEWIKKYSLYRNKVNATKNPSVTITFSSKYQSIALTKIMSEIKANTQ